MEAIPEVCEEIIVPDMGFTMHLPVIKSEAGEDQRDCLLREENVQMEVVEEVEVQTEPFAEILIPNLEENAGPYLIKVEPEETQQDHLDDQSEGMTSANTPEQSCSRFALNPRCKQCDITYRVHPNVLAWHNKYCHGPEPLVKMLKIGMQSYQCQCVFCPAEFNNFISIIRHLRYKHKLVDMDLPFPCNQCSNQYFTNLNLKMHQSVCKKKKRKRPGFKMDQQCNLCNIKYTHREMLPWHYEHCHGPYAVLNVIQTSEGKSKYQCVQCKQEGGEIIFMLQHLREQHQFVNFPYACNFCSKSFMKRNILAGHERGCSNNNFVQVVKNTEKADKSTKETSKNTKKVVRNTKKPVHQKTVKKNDLLKCDKCYYNFLYPEMLAWHVQYCHGENPIADVLKSLGVNRLHKLQCIQCKDKFNETIDLMKHLINKHQFVNLPFPCEICGRKLISKYALKKHHITCKRRVTGESSSKGQTLCLPTEQENVHSTDEMRITIENEMSLKCGQCEITYECPELLTWHTDHCHGPEAIVNIVKQNDREHSFHCARCETNYTDLILVIHHLRFKHQLVDLPFKCIVCRHQFVTDDRLKKHGLHCKMAFNCEKCKFNTKSKTELVTHMLAHQTPSTSVSMKSKKARLRQTRVTTKLKCKQCKISYGDPEILAWHVKYCHGRDAVIKIIKTGHKKFDFQCTACEVKYSSQQLIIRHVRAVHGIMELPFQCSDCKINFTFKYLLVRHQAISCKKRKTVPRPVRIARMEMDDGGILTSEIVVEEHTIKCEMEDSQQGFDSYGSRGVSLPLDSKLLDCRVSLTKLLECDVCSFYTTNATELATHMQAQHQAPSTSISKKPKKQLLKPTRIRSELKVSVSKKPKKQPLKPTRIRSELKVSKKPKKQPLKETKISSGFQCEKCKINYRDRELLVWHLKYCHGPDAIIKKVQTGGSMNFQCIACKGYHKRLTHAMRHVRSAHGITEMPFQCPDCKKTFEIKYILKQHRELYCQERKIIDSENNSVSIGPKKKGRKGGTERSLHCEECGVKFLYWELLKWHSPHFHGTNPLIKAIKLDDLSDNFQCSTCESSYSDITLITQHLHVKHGLINLPFPCKNCDKQFIKRYDLKRHNVLCRKVIKTKLSYNEKCDQCRMQFAYPEMLTWHVENFHGPNPIVKLVKDSDKRHSFECVFCNYQHKAMVFMIRHLRDNHQIENLPFHCEICNKKFPSSYHMNLHSCQKKKRSVTQRDVNVMDNLPIDSNDVLCKFCDEKFKTEKQLKNHVYIYHGQFKCDYCDDLFNLHEQLDEHCNEMHRDLWLAKLEKMGKVKKHSTSKARNEKLQEWLKNAVFCHYCNAVFKHKDYLKIHIRNVHTGQIVHCAHCKYFTRRKSHLVRHIRCWHLPQQ